MIERERPNAFDALVRGIVEGLAGAEAELPFDPQPGPQTRLLETDCEEVFYGGARGGGKTFGLLLDWLTHSNRYGPAARGIIFRRQAVDLESIIDESRNVFSRVGATWRPGAKTWVFRNGSTLRFRHLAKDSDTDKYLGHQYTFIGIEEAGTYASFGPIRKLRATMRSAAGVKPRLHLNGNPGGVGHNWLKQRYVTAGPPGVPIVEDVDGIPMSRVYIPAKVSDNEILLRADPTYVARIAESGPDWLVAAWLDGNWDVVAGGMFDDLFGADVYRSPIVVPPLRVESHWEIERSFDWGSSKPFSVGWWWTSDGSVVQTRGGEERVFPRGSVVRLAEWYGCNSDRINHANEGIGLTAREIAAGILERETELFGRPCAGGVADSAIWIGTGTSSQSIAAEMAEVGVHFAPCAKGPGSRISGWAVMRERMQAAITPRSDRPGLYVTSTCVDWLRTLPSIPRDPRNLDDVDTAAEDHAADETRYFLTSPTYTYEAGHTRDLWG